MSNIKIIARYLPQFHEIEENNKWHWQWFTERVNVKKAQSLYPSHIQPKIPYSYYNLLEAETRKIQWDLAKQYWIYGFCYYHYRFQWRKLLEKPLEKLLEDNYPDINFCLSWANHSWTKKWWGEGKDETLLEQTYWLEEDRTNHFNYLLNFFKKPKYILVENKPLFVIYNIKEIPFYDEMILCRNTLSKENGFDGIYILETLNSFSHFQISSQTDGVVQFEPLLTFSGKNMPYIYKFITGIKLLLHKYLWLNFIYRFSYNIIWEKILNWFPIQKYPSKKYYFWWFANRDNTPRKQRKWYIVTGSSPKQFKKYLNALLKKSKKYGNEFLFLNAWNEWAEWCYLEPDKENGYWYLEAIKDTQDH